jgi:hypothetical protein
MEQCKVGITRQWVPKATKAVANTNIEAPVSPSIAASTSGAADLGKVTHTSDHMLGITSDDPPDCEEGFLMVRGRSRSRYEVGEGSKTTAAALLSTINGFEVLAEHDTHQIKALGATSHPTNE